MSSVPIEAPKPKPAPQPPTQPQPSPVRQPPSTPTRVLPGSPRMASPARNINAGMVSRQLSTPQKQARDLLNVYT